MQWQETYITDQYGEDLFQSLEKAVKKGTEDPGCSRSDPSYRHSAVHRLY